MNIKVGAYARKIIFLYLAFFIDNISAQIISQTSVIAGSPSSNYDQVQPIDLEIDVSGNKISVGYYTGSLRNPLSLVAGSWVNSTNRYIIKWNSNAQFAWGKNLDGLFPNDIDTDAVGNIYIVGSEHIGGYDSDMSLQKRNADGTYAWGFRIESTNPDEFFLNISIDNNNNIYVLGRAGSSVDIDPGAGVTLVTGYFLGVYDSNGNFLRIINIPLNQTSRKIKLDHSNNILVYGLFTGTVDFNPDPSINNSLTSPIANAYVAKYSNDGNYLWVKQLQSNGNGTEPTDISFDNNNNILLTGTISGTRSTIFDPGIGLINLTSNGTNQDIFLAKYEPSGLPVFAFNIGNTNPELMGGVKTDNNGNIYLTGKFSGTVDFDPLSSSITNLTQIPDGVNSGINIFLSKYDPMGNFIWASGLTGGAPIGIDINEQNNVFVQAQVSTIYMPTVSIYKVNNQVNQSISFNQILSTCPGVSQMLVASSTSGLPIIFSSSNPSVATIAGNTLTITGVGTSTITASQLGNNDFFAAPSVSQVLTINPMPTPVVTPSGPITFCQGNSITLTANSGASYLWSTGATTQSISVSTSGNYSVKVTNASGCSATSEATSVTVNPAPLDANITANTASICIGQSVTISSSGGSGTPYYWASTNGGQSWDVFAQQYGGQSSFNFTPTQPGTYRFHVRNQNNCGFCWETNTCSTYAYVDVVVNAGPVENSITANTSSICLGQSITISSSGGTGTPYYWASTNGGQSWDVFAQQYGGQSSFNFTPSQAGTYRFHVRTQNGCGFCWDTNTCSVYSYVDVTVNAVPVPAITGSLTTCNGSQTTLTAVPGVSGNFLYQWSNGSTSASVTVGTGTYTVTVSNSANSSCAATATVTVTQGSTVGEIYSSGDLCQDGQVLLIAGSGSSYSWNPGPIGPSSIYVWNPGIFNVSYYNTSGCYVTAVIKVKRSIPNCPIARTTGSTPTSPILSDSLSQSNSEAGQDTELFQLFPSPAYKLLNIRLSAAYPVSCTVDIFDQLGKLAHRSTLEAGETDKQINIADFASGVYIVQLKNHNQLMKKRIIFVGN